MWISLLFFAFLPVKETDETRKIKHEERVYISNSERTSYKFFAGNNTNKGNKCKNGSERLYCNWKSYNNTSIFLCTYIIQSMNEQLLPTATIETPQQTYQIKVLTKITEDKLLYDLIFPSNTLMSHGYHHYCRSSISIVKYFVKEICPEIKYKRTQNVTMSFIKTLTYTIKRHELERNMTTSYMITKIIIETWNSVDTFLPIQTLTTCLLSMCYVNKLLMFLYAAILIHSSLEISTVKYVYTGILLITSVTKVRPSNNISQISSIIDWLSSNTSQIHVKTTPIVQYKETEYKYKETEYEYSSLTPYIQPTFQHLITNLDPISTGISTNEDTNCKGILPSVSDNIPVPSTYIIATSFELIRKIRGIRYQAYRDNILSDNVTTRNMNNTELHTYRTSCIYFSTRPHNNISTTSANNVSMSQTVSILHNVTVIPLTREEIAYQEFMLLISSFHYTLENLTATCIMDDNPFVGNGTYINNLNYSNNLNNINNLNYSNNFNNLWYDLTHGDKRLDTFASSIHFCLKYGFCSNETIEFNSTITLSSIWNTVMNPVQQFIDWLSPAFNISTHSTRFHLGNSTGCIAGYTRYTNESDCELKDKYIISLAELWFEFSKPAYFVFDILSSINVRLLNVSVNCSNYHNFTQLSTNLIPNNKSLNSDDFFDIYMNATISLLKENCSIYYNGSFRNESFRNESFRNESASCNITIPDICYRVKHPNETLIDLLYRHEMNFMEADIAANCSFYGFYGYPNITFFEMWDKLMQPSNNLLEFLSNITSNLKLVSVNCSHYDTYIHSNISLSQIWRQLEKSEERILQLLSSIYFRLPNVTVKCYDYPANITISPGYFPWYENPLIYLIGGGVITFILTTVVISHICKYCQKYSGVYIPGSETTEKEKAADAKEKRNIKKARAYRNELKSKGWHDPNRPRRRKRKRRKKKGKLTAAAKKRLEEEAKKDWILRHMDTMPDIEDTAVTAC